jgi:nicotinate-nucleotide pyrophosphorylase (carboxylating)
MTAMRVFQLDFSNRGQIIRFAPMLLDQFIQNALKEDVGTGDHTSRSTIPANHQGKARLLVKDNGILAGVELAASIFDAVDPELKMEVFIKDGCDVNKGDVAFTVSGNSINILTAERLVLNCMQRMSGIATRTREVTDRISPFGCKVLDTRKTTPGMRLAEKWAVSIGGGVNHRFGLFDMILIKDNHVDFAGGVHQAITAAKNYLNQNQLNLEIEIEARNLKEVEQILEHQGIKRILLDNFAYPQLEEAVVMIAGKTETEASGGITLWNCAEYAKTGVNYISMGELTHSVKAFDLSLKAC